MQTHKYSQTKAGLDFNNPTNQVAWANGRNVRFRRGAVYKHPGKKLLASLPNSNPIRALYSFRDSSGAQWLLACQDAKIYALKTVSATLDTIYDITPTSAPVISSSIWSFALAGGIPFLCNGGTGGGVIWQWTPNSPGTPGSPAKCTITANSPANPKIIWAHQNRLFVACAMPSASNKSVAPIIWYSKVIGNPMASNLFSISPPPGAGSDARYGSAGSQYLVSIRDGGNQVENIIAGVSNGTSCFIYTDGVIWVAQNSEFGYTFKQESEKYEPPPSMNAASWVTSYEGPGLYHIGTSDFYKNGESIGTPVKNVAHPYFNGLALNTAFSFYNNLTEEVFFCVATGSNSYPDTSYIYNIGMDNWSVCDCDFTFQASWSYSPSSITATDLNWDGTNHTWVDNPNSGAMLLSVLSDSSGNLYAMDGKVDNDVGGSTNAISSYIETGDIHTETLFSIRDIYPSLKASSGQQAITVSAGYRYDTSSPVRWSPPQQYDLSSGQRKVPSRGLGWYNRVRFGTKALGSFFALQGYQLSLLPRGLR